MGQAESPRARQRLIPDYTPGLQYGVERVHDLVRADAAARLQQGDGQCVAWVAGSAVAGSSRDSVPLRVHRACENTEALDEYRNSHPGSKPSQGPLRPELLEERKPGGRYANG